MTRIIRSLGRRYAPDENDQKFLMRRRMRAAGTPRPTSKTWGINPTALAQLNTSTCVGHGWANFLRCAPIRTNKGIDQLRWDIYRAAVADDEWSSNDNEATLPNNDPGLNFGTSVRAGAKAVTAMGRLKSYLWSFELQPALEWVLFDGPVVVGTNWYNSFDNPDAEGIIKITVNARIDGGHCYLWRGVNLRRGLARITNSWGDEWGLSGDAWIPLESMERLIHEQGEICSAIEQRLQPKAV